MLTMMVYATLMKFWVAPILQPATIWKMQQRTVEHAFCLLIVKHVQEKQMAQVQLQIMTKTAMGYVMLMKLRDVWMPPRAITMPRPQTMVEGAYMLPAATTVRALQMEAGLF